MPGKRPYTTDKQREAARRNGARSRGPVTAAGKRNSSANNRRHLLASTSLDLVRSDPGYVAILDDYRRAFPPADPVEDELLAAMAACRWRSQRSRDVESAIIDYYAAEVAADSGPECGLSEREALYLGFRRALENGISFDALHRYDARDMRRWVKLYESLLHSKGIGPLRGSRNKKLPFEPERVLTSRAS